MIDVFKVRLDLQQVCAVKVNFFPYLEMLCQTKLKDAGRNEDQVMTWRVISAILDEIILQFDRKILNEAKRPTLKFTLPQALTFYRLLLQLPLDHKQVWLLNLRSLITITLHKQMSEP